MNQRVAFFDFSKKWAVLIAGLLFLIATPPHASSQETSFDVMEATIGQIQAAFKAGRLTSRQLVQLYLNRIEAYDQKGPKINSIITLNKQALQDADKLDAAFKASGLVGPLHGIPVTIKDQLDVKGMPTTMGSVVFKNWIPDKDSFVVDKLRKAGAIILAKVTLGEMGGGDTYGSLFGVTRNPYDVERTVGGSSGGPAASVSANFTTVAVGEEGYASIRRPATWNSVVGLRPTPGLVSRTGMWNGFPDFNGSLGPMARTVEDAVRLFDLIVGYDSDDPVTSFGVGHVSEGGYMKFLDKSGLRGARLGILRESIGQDSEPASEDFKAVAKVFDKTVEELKAAGAIVVDPIVIPKLKELLATRAGAPNYGGEDIGWKYYFRGSPNAPYKSRQEMTRSPEYAKVLDRGRPRGITPTGGSPITPTNRSEAEAKYVKYILARQELLTNLLKVMADNKLDAIVYRSVEHTATLIKDGINPPYVNEKGVPTLSTFLQRAATVTVPAGFTPTNQPVGVTFQVREYDEGRMIRLAYAYEQATHHRKPPKATPPLTK